MSTQHRHIYKLRPFEWGIMEGICVCGERNYSVSFMDNGKKYQELLAKVVRLNKEAGMDSGAVNSPSTSECSIPASVNELPPIPPRSPGSRRRYYDANKALILKYIEVLGEREALLRWGISAATWAIRRSNGQRDGLAYRWGLISDKYVGTVKMALPEFPEFNSSWTPDVQMKWLECYVNLKRG